MSTGNSDVEIDLESDNDGYYDYYNDDEEDFTEIEPADPKKLDPEYFEFKCLTTDEVDRFLNESVEFLCNSLPIKPSVAKLLLHLHGWTTSEILNLFRQDASKLLIDSRIKPDKPPEIDPQVIQSSKSLSCSICLLSFSGEYFYSLACCHYFCKDCWSMHFELQIFQGVTTNMECMGQGCSLLVPEDFVFSILNKSSSREKYQVFAFSDYVKSHPQLRFCTGPNCDLIIFAKECQSKRVMCKQCKTTFCFKCGADYHVPTDCETIKKWLIKCIDDSETANYFIANTKDCPKCHMCIEKNGGCNRIVCYICKYQFCWMCLKDWNVHGYTSECSVYKENPDVANESVQVQAREALKKYLFYFERWENHARSLRLEEQTLQKIKEKINKKVMANEGTWIDWQYLLDAAALLAKCRYTLQYTYPYAYYMENGPRKELFEYQQAQLEAEIENLSFKIERAETTDRGLEYQQAHLEAEIENLIIEGADRGDLENQMDVAEKRRATLLKDFSDL